MKLIRLAVVMLAILFTGTLFAQVSVSINIGTPPVWGPPVQADVRYYYLPDVDAYYDINTSVFIYFYNGKWIERRHLPARFRNYDLYRGRKIIVHNYLGNAPYSHCNYHINKNKRERDFERMVDRTEKPHSKAAYFKQQKFHNEQSRHNNKKERK